MTCVPRSLLNIRASFKVCICASSSCDAGPLQFQLSGTIAQLSHAHLNLPLEIHQLQTTRPHSPHVFFLESVEILMIVVEQIGGLPELLPILRRLELGDAGFNRSDGLSIPSIAFVERIRKRVR